MAGSTAAACVYAIVQQVTIAWIDDKNVSFTTRGSRPGGRVDQNLRKTFTVPLTEVYTRPIDGAPSPVDMFPGATGNLYLSRLGWLAVSPDGFQIYGCEQAVFKYPECGAIATPLITRLTVIPTSIVIRGHLPEQTVFFEIELSGPDADEAQHIAWNGANYIDLRLTERGCRRIGLGSHPRTVQLWPTKIRIKGSPAIDQEMLGEVDVLDPELAAGMQDIAFAWRGAPVTLLLTPDGVNAFHVTPQAVAEAACAGEPEPHGAVVLSSGHGASQQAPEVNGRRMPE